MAVPGHAPARVMGQARYEDPANLGVGQVVDGQSAQWAVDLMPGCGITPELLESLGIPVACPWRPGMCANP